MLPGLIIILVVIVTWIALSQANDAFDVWWQNRHPAYRAPRGHSLMACKRWNRTGTLHRPHTWRQTVNGGGLGLIGVRRWCPGNTPEEVEQYRSHEKHRREADAEYRRVQRTEYEARQAAWRAAHPSLLTRIVRSVKLT
jgi:hypothetical protein